MKGLPTICHWLAVIAASVALVSVASVALARAESSLSVVYRAPRISIEAHDVSLEAVLTTIGAQAGFGVVETGRSSATVTFSIENGMLEDVLAQLLRAENHTVLYRAGDGPTPASPVIDRIVLLGTPENGGPAVASTGQSPLGRESDDQVSPTAIPTPRPDPLPSADRVASWDPSALPQAASEPGALPVTVGDLLKASAMAGAPSITASPSMTQPGESAAAPAPDTPPPGLGSTLADTTRRAQQALGALMDGLAAATRSMNQSRSESGK